MIGASLASSESWLLAGGRRGVATQRRAVSGCPNSTARRLRVADAQRWPQTLQCRLRTHALAVAKDMVKLKGRYPERWASAMGAVLAVGFSAVKYSLRELNGWLSRGGMTLGAPPCAAAMRCDGGQSSCLGPAADVFRGVAASIHAG